MISYEIYKKDNNLVKRIIEHFISKEGISENSVLKFCLQNTRINENGQTELIYNPETIVEICNKLSEHNILKCIKSDNSINGLANYLFMNNTQNINMDSLYHCANSIVFGFEYIYNYYADSVVPVINVNREGTPQIGTCIIVGNAIVTAKHCLEDAASISIKGVSSNELNNAKIYVSENEKIDIAVIELNKVVSKPGYIDEGKVLEDVIVMGYPKIAGFINFLTIEKATISSKKINEVTTKGQITSYATSIFSKSDLMLITAKIRGGNSGSPVINQYGNIVGLACQTPDFEGDYDDLGYGVVFPSNEIKKIIDKKVELGHKINFIDYRE